jgi:hypothetical protein
MRDLGVVAKRSVVDDAFEKRPATSVAGGIAACNQSRPPDFTG